MSRWLASWSMVGEQLLEQYKDVSDEELLALSVKQPAVFEVLVGRYEDAFRRRVRAVLGNRCEVDDVLQDTFVKIYMNASRFKPQPGASFKSWAYKILLNTTFTRYQKLKKDEGATVALEPEFAELFGGAAPMPEHEITDFIASVISRMPQALGRILSLHFLSGMPHAEIARQEDLSISAVKTRVHRAKKEFRRISSELGN